MTSPVSAVFSSATDGDLRADLAARRRFSRSIGVPDEWAIVSQVHGASVVSVDGPGSHGDADALITVVPHLPLAVFTADCLGIVIDARPAVAVVHAGWRGLDAGVIEHTLERLDGQGWSPRQAWVGPSIGPCCFEVGDEVAARFTHHLAATTWGTTAVDLRGVARSRLGVPVSVDERCTRCAGGLFSHREDGTLERMAAVGWTVA